MESREEREGQGKGEPQWHYKVPLAPRKGSRGKSRLEGAGEGGGEGGMMNTSLITFVISVSPR